MTPAMLPTLQNEVASADYRICPWFQGGYAELDPTNNRLVLGLSWWVPRKTAAGHELFHVTRHLSHSMTFRGLGSTYPLRLVVKEESLVWFLTAVYKPLGCFLLLAGFLFLLVGLFTAAFAISNLLLWVLGL